MVRENEKWDPTTILEGMFFHIGLFSDSNIRSTDGVSIWIKSTMSALASEGHTTFVVCPASTESFREEEGNAYTIGPARPLTSYPSYGVVGRPVSAIGKVGRILMKEKPDVIHSNTPLIIGFAALWASKTLGIPLVGTLHTLLPEMVKHYPPLKLKTVAEILGWQIYNHYYNLCDVVTCPTPIVKRMLLERGIRRKIILVPNGVDVDRFQPSDNVGKDFRATHCIPNDNTVILFTGRLSFEKRVDLLIMAFKRLLKDTEAFLLILGDGPLKYALIELVKKLKLGKRVIFLGGIEHDDDLIPVIYNAADIFVLPSMFETQGLSVLEAMACGKTVVATSVGGNVSLIEDKHNGVLVRPNDSDELANALKTLATDDQTRRQMGKAARKTAEAYSIKSTTRRLTHIYRSLTVETPHRTFSDIPHTFLYSFTFFSTYTLFCFLLKLKMI